MQIFCAGVRLMHCVKSFLDAAEGEYVRLTMHGDRGGLFTLLEEIQNMGDKVCPYNAVRPWPRSCDCKYGVEDYDEQYTGEQTGCCELSDLADKIQRALVE